MAEAQERCDHDWSPHPSGYSRYRCPKCGAFGCKTVVRESRHRPDLPHKNDIRAYCCGVCGAPAVARDRNSRGTNMDWRCPDHRRSA
jgi:predicted RNA-binding Zn-ribbon protein involved in translation (DUF1610 family)